MKTALEIALEKMNAMDLPEANIARDELVMRGRRMGAALLRGDKGTLDTETKELSAADRAAVSEGAEATLLANVVLPDRPAARDDNRRALELLAGVKGNAPLALELCGQIDQLMETYTREREQGIVELRRQFEQKLRQERKQARTAAGAPVELEPEQLPEFQRHILQFIAQLDADYTAMLSDLTAQLVDIPLP